MTSAFASVLVVDKPRGPTSHDVVARVRRLLRTRHVGHCGTLDPMATGVLVVAIEDGTKLVPWLTADDKAYEATIQLGVETDSLDADGVETRRLPLGEELVAQLRALEATNVPPLLARALDIERMRTSQMPPAISAIRIGGERAHEIARRGEIPELALREVGVKALELIGGGAGGGAGDGLGGGADKEPFLRVIVHVTKGYFVRSLARDLAASLGTVGHLTALRRTRSGAFTIEDAVSLEDDPDVIRRAVLHIDRAAARALPVSVLTADGVTAADANYWRPQPVLPGEIIPGLGALLPFGSVSVNAVFSANSGLKVMLLTTSRASPSASNVGLCVPLADVRAIASASLRGTGALKLKRIGNRGRQADWAFSRSQLKLAENGSRTVKSKRFSVVLAMPEGVRTPLP